MNDLPSTMRVVSCLAAALALGASPAVAQTAPARSPAAAPVAGHWSVATGETVSPDHDAIAFAAGWPGLRFDFIHGVSDRSDVGLRFELLYGLENTTGTKFGLGATIPFRLVVSRRDNVLLGLHVDPGVRLYTSSAQTDLFLRFPAGAIVGIQIAPDLRLAGGVDLNMALQVPNRTFFEINPSFGLGVEATLERGLIAGVNARFGPQFTTLANTGGEFAFTGEVIIGYRM